MIKHTVRPNSANAQDVINFVVARANASEEKPLQLGNVQFWHPIAGFPVALCYSLPTSKWDLQAVQDELNRITAPYWDEMCEHLTKTWGQA